ncbi:MAG: SDR family oxidoreductase [Saprospirales bacterium]|nr:MAG: SDR family oxidoreductase [Saprospirales bacterium]
MKAFITGASLGIGKAIAEALAAKGYDLILNARNSERLKHFSKNLTGKYPSIHCDCLAADLTDPKERSSLTQSIRSRHQKLDVVVNNAGIFETGDCLQDPEVFETAIDLHLKAPFYLIVDLSSLLRASRNPHVINIASVQSKTPNAQSPAYSVSKYALRGLSDNMREVFKKDGIKVTNVMPGYTWSNSWEGAEFPRERLMEPEDIAKVVVCALTLGKSAVMEEVVLRPQLGEFPD